LIKFIPYLIFLTIVPGCSVVVPGPQLVIDSGNIEKRVVFEDTIRGCVKKIQLTDFHPSPGPEISIMGQTGIWFLSPRDYKSIETYRFNDAEGEPIWFGLNPELLDINDDGIYEIMQGGGGFGEVGLLDSKGNMLWSFQPDPKLPPKRMVPGDLNADKTYEFYVADYRGLYQLNDKGKVMWKVNGETSRSQSFHDVKIFTDKKAGRRYLITVVDDGVFQIYDFRGKKIRQFPTGFQIYKFEIVEWKEKVFILAGYFRRKAVLMDLSGKVVYEFRLENFPLYHAPQGVAVNFSPTESEYMVLLAHSRSSVGLTQLNIISPDGRIIYQEIINDADGFIPLDISDKNKEVLIIGDGHKKVLEYKMTTN